VRSSTPLLLYNIGQLLTLAGPDNSKGPRRGRALAELGLCRQAAVLCVGGKIVAAGGEREMLRHPLRKKLKRLREVDCGGRVALPGFVDSHTHLVFAAPRLNDFERRIAGDTYEEVAAAGGGILSSVAAVRESPKDELAEKALAGLRRMLAQGTTTVEAKSGYGLATPHELKQLVAIHRAAQQWPGTVVPTLLGAHVVPPEYGGQGDAYVEEICRRMIPVVGRRKLARFVDVFCERGAFTPDQTRKIFAAAKEHGLGVRAHAGQFTPAAVAELLPLQPASLDHMDQLADADTAALARSRTVVTLLPGSNFFLGLRHYPPARHLIDSGVAVALATDYNPGTSPTTSMGFVLSLASTQMKMQPAEAIVAATINGAHALRLAKQKGSLEPGKDADLAVFDVRDYREIPYWLAEDRCWMVVARGLTN